MAVGLNKTIFKHVREQLDVANKELGLERGEAPDVQSVIEFEDNAGNTIKFNSSDFVDVVRNGETMLIRACAIVEGDELPNV
jgi:hypothetical protein